MEFPQILFVTQIDNSKNVQRKEMYIYGYFDGIFNNTKWKNANICFDFLRK